MQPRDLADWELIYQDAMELYDDAATDAQREEALMLASQALINMEDHVERLRVTLNREAATR